MIKSDFTQTTLSETGVQKNNYPRNGLKDLLGKVPLFFDGGTGTVLQTMGLKPGELTETWNLKHPDRIQQLHYDYFMAGANIIKSNTFGCFVTKFPLDLERTIKAGLENANIARNKAVESGCNKDKLFIAFDISTTGQLLKPMGSLDFEDCISLYKKTFRIALGLAAAGGNGSFDCILIETMNDGYETKAAVIGAKEVMAELGFVDKSGNCSMPIFVSNVYDKDCRTLSGSTPETMVAMLEGLEVDALGVNCSLGPVEMTEAVSRLCKAASVPVIVNPNAGLPKVIDGVTTFDVGPDEFVDAMVHIKKLGAGLLGGCCGTNPEYIKKMVNNNVIAGPIFNKDGKKDDSRGGVTGSVSSNSEIVYFGNEYKTVLIGERINPTGKKKFKEALRNNDIPYIIHQGLEQENAGADVLDVNVGLPEIDEKEMMISVMSELQAVTNLPLQIDTTNSVVMEAALRRYNGKAMINSVNGKQEIMDSIFPLVKKYGGLVVALTLDERGIPETSRERIDIAKKIYKEAEKYGIKKCDIIIDPLAMAVSSDTKAGIATMETVKAIHEMGGLTSLGISNISFGLPKREFVTSSFFTMAMNNGLSAAIMNPLQDEMIKSYRAYNMLAGKDENCSDYISWATEFSEKEAEKESLQVAPEVKKPSVTTKNNDGEPAQGTLEYSIIHGLKQDSAEITKVMLESMESLEIINNHLIPGLDFVGKRFEEKTMYLPQLLMAAEAAKSAFGEIRNYMEKTGKKGQPKGKVIIATVKGDIHDIGKNIVKVLMENYDFEVIDLGKDVAPEIVVEACKKDNVKLVGLSALMTTTVVAMEETIKLLRKECPGVKICVGGAVMTQEYADQIGADFYGKDAMDSVRYALDVFSDKN